MCYTSSTFFAPLRINIPSTFIGVTALLSAACDCIDSDMATPTSFRARLRLPSSKQAMLTLPQPVTIRALLEGIQPFVGVDLTQIGLRLAYPPKVIELGRPDEWKRTVDEVGINNGEGLVVTIVNETSNTQHVSTSSPTTPQPVPSEPAPVHPPSPPQTSMEQMNRSVTPDRRDLSAKRYEAASIQEEPPEIPVEGGFVVPRIMEDDNSCMYFVL